VGVRMGGAVLGVCGSVQAGSTFLSIYASYKSQSCRCNSGSLLGIQMISAGDEHMGLFGIRL
jgi:hypothetical protein